MKVYVSPVLILASTLQQFAFKCVVRELPEIFNRKTDLHFNVLLKNFKIPFFSVTSHYQRNGRHYRNYSYLGAILNSFQKHSDSVGFCLRFLRKQKIRRKKGKFVIQETLKVEFTRSIHRLGTVSYIKGRLLRDTGRRDILLFLAITILRFCAKIGKLNAEPGRVLQHVVALLCTTFKYLPRVIITFNDCFCFCRF